MIDQWLSMWGFLWHGIPSSGSAFPRLLVAVGAVVFVSAILFGESSSVERHVALFGTITLARSTMETFVLLALVTPLGCRRFTRTSVLTSPMPLSRSSRAASAVLMPLRWSGVIMKASQINRVNSRLWEIYMNRPAGFLNITGSGLTRQRDDFLQAELARNYRSETTRGNRDQPLGHARSGLRTGVAGWHRARPSAWIFHGARLGRLTRRDVRIHLETQNHSDLAGSAGIKFELLNLAVPGYRPPQQVMALDEALKFAPHLVFYTAAGREQWNTINFLADILEKEVDIPYPDLKALIEAAGVKSDMYRATILKQLKLHDKALLQWVYGSIARRCSEAGARPVWIYLPPIFPERRRSEERGRSRELAQAAGFEIIDLAGIFEAKIPMH